MALIDTLRKPQIPFTGGMVMFDWLSTYLFALIISNKFSSENEKKSNTMKLFIILILLSIYIHYIMDIPTVTNYYLNLSRYPDRTS